MLRFHIPKIVFAATLILGHLQMSLAKPNDSAISVGGIQLGTTRTQVQKLLHSKGKKRTFQIYSHHAPVTEEETTYSSPTGPIVVRFDQMHTVDPTVTRISTQEAIIAGNRVKVGQSASDCPLQAPTRTVHSGTQILEGILKTSEATKWYFKVNGGYAEITFSGPKVSAICFDTSAFQDRALLDWQQRKQ